MSGSSKHLSCLKRDPERFNNKMITERDVEIMRIVLWEGFLTTSQIQHLFFGYYTACCRRLQVLVNKGFLRAELTQPVSFGNSERIFCVTKQGVNYLEERLGKTRKDLGWNPQNLKITSLRKLHEIQVNEVKMRLISATAKRFNLFLDKCKPNANPVPDLQAVDKILCCEKGTEFWDYVKEPNPDGRGKRGNIPLRPDRYIGFLLDEPVYGFVEVDRGTLSDSTFGRRLRGYREYYRSGGYLTKYGEGNDIAQYPFRVYTITPDERRRNNLVEQAILEKYTLSAWFTTYAEFISDPLGLIWMTGKDYLDILNSFSEKQKGRILETPEKQRSQRHLSKVSSRARKERDKIIAARIGKYSLLQ